MSLHCFNAYDDYRDQDNANNNIQQNSHSLTQNINYNNNVTKERNTIGCNDNEYPIKKLYQIHHYHLSKN